MQNVPYALFDMDGTLADYDGALQVRLNEIAGPNDPPWYGFEDETRPAWLEARRHLITSAPGFFRNLPPLETGMMILRITQEIGFQHHILSKGPLSKPLAWGEKLEWCGKYVPDASVAVVTDKALTSGHVLVDDFPPYFRRWLQHNPKGVVLVPAHPWNKGCEDLDPARIFRFDPLDSDAPSKARQILQAVFARKEDEWIDVRAVLR